ncbi:sensor domain-containing diguanylate cyclase [Geoalkalibacter sp.]|uniref:sensor domain-containing diguanylate cyclase n=1 Tax=Geoalkalibacter sp. TaxID=3041440 RepID=UPI00272E1FF4|nr:GGDEF domain-containing protein [Geoalkalibacter sp.]
MAAIQDVLRQDIKLPSPPAIAVRILEAVRGDDSSFRDLGRIIAADPALSAKILRVANSSVYSLRYPVDTIEKAIGVLGVDQLKNIALSFVIAQGMRGSSEGEFSFDYFWRRAITAAVGAELVAERMGCKTQDTFVTALLMDLGIVVMYGWDTKGYLRVLGAKRARKEAIVVLEKRAFGFDHGELGGELLKSWGLPESIWRAVRNHHGGVEGAATSDPSGEVLVLADALSSIYHGSRASQRLAFVKERLTHLGLGAADVDALIDAVAEKTLEVLSSFDLDPGKLKPFSQLLQEANEELGKLNLSYEQLVMELKQAKEKAERLAEELAEANDKLQELAFRDGLTGLYNHRYFQDLLSQEVKRAVRYHRPIGLVMFDIDHFKKINDNHGHPVGDQVLKALARKIESLTRRTDVVARYGGEEFAVVLPETDAKGVGVLAQRLRRGIEQLPIATDAGELRITVSVGATCYDAEQGLCCKDELIEAADAALYAAKRAGRNQVGFQALALLEEKNAS